MKKILILISLFVSLNCLGQKAIQKKDTIYCMVGFNATRDDGNMFSGSCGMKCYTKILTAKEIEDEVKRQNGGLKKVVILALTYMAEKQFNRYWSKSNNLVTY